MSDLKNLKPNGTSVHRIFDGFLKVCSSDDKKNYKVKLMLLNELPNRNKWQFPNIAEHISEAEDIPVLYSVINNKIGNSHDFEVVTDMRTGKEYCSFIGAESEHPYGWIPSIVDGEKNAKIETIDGVEWLTATAYLPSFYNTEMIAELERNGGQMAISIETLVYKCHMDGEIEVQDEYSIVGVTILGTSVEPAVAGANIRKLSANSEQLEKLKLRVASLASPKPIEPQTQTKNNKRSNTKTMKVRNLEDLRALFPGYTVLAVNGGTVALLSEKGRTYAYSFKDDEETVVPERIAEVVVNSVFGDGDESVSVSTEQLVGVVKAQLNATQKALETKTNENAELAKQLKDMKDAEFKRRQNAVKEAIKSQLAENAKDSDVKFADNLCDKLLTNEKLAEYAAMEKNGEFCGDENAKHDVDALCMSVIRDEGKKVKQEAARKANASKFSWQNAVDSVVDGANGGNALANAVQNITDD